MRNGTGVEGRMADGVGAKNAGSWEISREQKDILLAVFLNQQLKDIYMIPSLVCHLFIISHFFPSSRALLEDTD
jgi:hypothetical protein